MPGEGELKQNRRLLMADGVLYYAGRALLDYNVVVPALISHLGASSLQVGLAASINRLGFFLPQIFVAHDAAARPLVKSLLLLGVKIYTCGLLALIPCILVLSARAPGAALALFYVFYAMACAGDGVQALPWVDILAKTVASTRRGRLLGWMQTLGGIASFGMAALVAWVVSRAWLPFPVNYMLLALLAALLGLASLKVLGLLHEPPREAPETHRPLREYLASIPGVVRENPGFSRFLGVRALSQSLLLAAPFYVTYAIDALGAPKVIMGGFIAAQMAGIMLGGLLLGYVGDLYGNARSVRLSLTASLVPPLAGLFLGLGRAGGGFGWVQVLTFHFLYFFLGAALAGLWMTLQNYLLDLVGPDNRPTCVGLSNMLVAPMSFFPMLGGMLLAAAGYMGLFAITLSVGLAALGCSLGMREPRSPSAPGRPVTPGQ
jgi:MFS family permease